MRDEVAGACADVGDDHPSVERELVHDDAGLLPRVPLGIVEELGEGLGVREVVVVSRVMGVVVPTRVPRRVIGRGALGLLLALPAAAPDERGGERDGESVAQAYSVGAASARS